VEEHAAIKKRTPNPCLRAIKCWYFCLAMVVRTRIVRTKTFNNLVAGVILLAGVIVGLQTDGVFNDGTFPPAEDDKEIWTPKNLKSMAARHSELFISAVFIAELILKVVAEVFEPWNYFNNRWNCFDFSIVASGLLDIGGGAALVMRMFRLLRVLKLFRAFPQLQVLVETLEQACSSIFWIGVLLLLFFYISAIVAIMLFKSNDPWHFGNIHLSLMSLFRVTTLEDWTDIM
jgi:voltage-gated sodium channel